MATIRVLRLHFEAYRLYYGIFFLFTLIVFFVATLFKPFEDTKTYAYLTLIFASAVFSFSIGLTEYSSLFKTHNSILINRKSFLRASLWMGLFHSLFLIVLFVGYAIGFHFLPMDPTSYAFQDLGLAATILYFLTLLTLYYLACALRLFLNHAKQFYRVFLLAGLGAFIWFGKEAILFVQYYTIRAFSTANDLFIPYLFLLIGIQLLSVITLRLRVPKMDLI